jgi:hypothetical protein
LLLGSPRHQAGLGREHRYEMPGVSASDIDFFAEPAKLNLNKNLMPRRRRQHPLPEREEV